MAIALDTGQRYKAGFIANGWSADWSGCEEIVAAPGAGKAILISRIYINTLAAEIITIGEGETGGAVTTELIGPVYTGATSIFPFEFPGGLLLSENTSLTADSAGAGNALIVVVGRVIDV